MGSVVYLGVFLSILSVISCDETVAKGTQECVDVAKDCAHVSRCQESGGSAYAGQKASTISGQTCQTWPEVDRYDESLGIHNFCRNYDDVLVPWCNTDSGRGWEYCFVVCDDTVDDSTSSCVDLVNQCAFNDACKTFGLDGYRGTKSSTISGDRCQMWSSQSPHANTKYGLLGEHNYCRNPDNAGAPWCYTTDADSTWGYCFKPCSFEKSIEPCQSEPIVYSRDVSSVAISSPNYPKLYSPNLTCTWVIEPADAWTAVRLKFLDFETDNLDGVGIWQIEGDKEVFMDWFDGQGTRPDIITGLGNGLKIVFKSKGSSHGFRLLFERFTGVSWSGMDEQDLRNECTRMTDYKTVFLQGSCYVVGPKGTYTKPEDGEERGLVFKDAFHACNHFPKGHLALLNRKQLAQDISDPFYDFLYEGWAKWIGLNQTTKYIVDRHEDASAGWEWVLPDGQHWPARYEDTRWDKEDEIGGEPDNWGGQDCGAVDGTTSTDHYLNDIWCGYKRQYYCEYESLYPCSKILYNVTEPGAIHAPTASTKNIQCYYVLSTEYFNSIKLTLTNASLGPHDSIRVFDGNMGTSHQNLLVIWARKSQNRKVREVIGKSSALTVVFTGKARDSTFTAQYSKVESTCKCRNQTIKMNKHPGGNITSPGFPSNYCPNLDCAWDFEADGTEEVMQFMIETLDTEDNGDWLMIKGTQNTNESRSNLLAVYTERIGLSKLQEAEIEEIYLTENFKPVIFTAQHKTQLFFHSDNKVNGKGFKINYRTVRRGWSAMETFDTMEAHPYCIKKSACHCPQPQPAVYHQMKSSMKFWHTHGDCGFVDCKFLLPVPQVEKSMRKHLRLTIKGVADTRQPNGFLKISEGLPYHLSGRRQLINWRIVSGDVSVEYRQTLFALQPYIKAAGLTLHYHSEVQGTPMIGKNGFTLQYQWTTNCPCGKEKLRAEYAARLLLSPNYPKPYCPETNCTWIIEAPKNHRIYIQVLSIATESDTDILEIFDDIKSEPTSLARLSGIETQVHIKRSTERIKVLFRANNETELQGFELAFWTAPADGSLPTTPEPPSRIAQNKRRLLLIALIITSAICVLLFHGLLIILLMDLRRKKMQNRKNKVSGVVDKIWAHRNKKRSAAVETPLWMIDRFQKDLKTNAQLIEENNLSQNRPADTKVRHSSTHREQTDGAQQEDVKPVRKARPKKTREEDTSGTPETSNHVPLVFKMCGCKRIRVRSRSAQTDLPLTRY